MNSSKALVLVKGGLPSEILGQVIRDKNHGSIYGFGENFPILRNLK